MGVDIYIGIDLGTQSTKAVAIALPQDGGRAEIFVQSDSHKYDITSTRPGMAEQSPAGWIDAGVAAIRQVVERTNAECESRGCGSAVFGGVGCAGQQHGLVVLDEHKQVIRPAKLWCDTESDAEAKELGQPGPAFTATKLLWLKVRVRAHRSIASDRL